MKGRMGASRRLTPSAQASWTRLHKSAVKILSVSPLPERVKVADPYAAHSSLNLQLR